jgi:putative spermidine/putrescine transport system permease protein
MMQHPIILRVPLVLAILVSFFLIAPTMIVVPMSFSTAVSFEFPPPGYWLGYYRSYFSDPSWILPTANSLLIASITTVMTLAIVIPASLGYVRYKFRGRGLVNVLIMLPLIVPQVVSALGYYGYLSIAGLVGTRFGVVLAHIALAVPVTFLVICATLKGFDRNLERAALILGANPLRAFIYVVMPVLRPGMITAALFAFLSSFNEAVIAIFIAGRDASTLPKKMFESIQIEADPVIAVVSTLLIAIVFASVVAVTFFSRRKQTHVR